MYCLFSVAQRGFLFLADKLQLKHWVLSCCEYVKGYYDMSVDYSVPLKTLLDLPAVCFRPDRKDLLSKFNKYGLMFRCYDAIRTTS